MALFGSNKKKSDDGRDQWPSRTAFLLASVGGAVGQGNIIRYPSQVFNNVGTSSDEPLRDHGRLTDA